MKCKVLGIQRKTGSFEDKQTERKIAYDNFMLHCLCRNMDVSGQAVKIIKLKAENAGELLAAVGGKSGDVVGHTIDFDLGAFDRVLAYEVVE